MSATRAGTTIGPTTLLFQGTYVYKASTHAVSLRDGDGSRIAGTIVNDMMTLRAGRDTLVYYRQN